MVVVVEALLVNIDAGTPPRKGARIQLDFIAADDVPVVGHGDDTTRPLDIIILLRTGRRGGKSACRDRDR